MMKPLVSVILLLLMNGAVCAGQGKGVVSMSGQIIESACTIATDDIWQEVDFGTLSMSDISGGNIPSSKTVALHLVHCSLDKQDGGKWRNVTLTLDGPVHPDAEDMFALQGDGKGIGINITDTHGNTAHPGAELPVVELNEESTDLSFNIHLKRNSENLTAGAVSSFIRFMVAYQ